MTETNLEVARTCARAVVNERVNEAIYLTYLITSSLNALENSSVGRKAMAKLGFRESHEYETSMANKLTHLLQAGDETAADALAPLIETLRRQLEGLMHVFAKPQFAPQIIEKRVTNYKLKPYIWQY